MDISKDHLPEQLTKKLETVENVFQEMNFKPFWRRKEKLKDDSNIEYSYFQLFRFATARERLCTFLGIVIAILGALTLPFDMIFYGELTAMFADRIDYPERTTTATLLLPIFGGGSILTNGSAEEQSTELVADSIAFGLGVGFCACIKVVTCTLSVNLVNYSGLKQISRLRKIFLQSVLRQEMAYFDVSAGGNFATRVTDNLNKIKEGISEKLAIFAYLFSSFIICIIFSLFYGWKLTLVILSCTPFIILSTALAAKIHNTLSRKELASYSAAGDVADEVLGGIRTVTAFGGEQKEIYRYKERLQTSLISGQRKGLYSGLSNGIMWTLIYWSYAVAFWYGAHLILVDDEDYTPAVIIIILFCILTGAQNIGASSPHLEAFSMAKSAATSVFTVIDRDSKIDSLSQDGLRPSEINGTIELKNVHFRYPARPDVIVLNGLNLTIKAGQTVALVGPSGCGKSTIIQLIQRLYDALEGSILMNGIPIQEINTTWLRSFIGVVGQEPVLFATTIAENIRFGNPQVNMEGIQNAAKIANCHDFIQKLPNGYDTLIGESNQLSGGQKQRIAIARALVRNPKILLLDEATSALDPSSEKRVQHALDRASQGRTTIAISHRLSTITNADRIIYIDNGIVVEDGTHKELLELKGHYFNLVSANNANFEKKKDAMLPLRKSLRRRLSSTSPSVYSGDSDSDDEDEDEEPKVVKKVEEKYPVSMMRIIKLNGKEWPYILLGSIAAIIMGASLPTFAIIFGEYFEIMTIADEELFRQEVNWLSISFILLGLMAGLSTFIQTFMLNFAGARLTLRLREQVFEATMKQEMGWFDQTENAVGALGARLSGDCASVQGATGSRIGSILQSVSTIMIGIGVSLYFSWKLTAVSIILVPIVLAACFFESRYMAMSDLEEQRAMEGGCQMASEAITHIRTVASLGQEQHVIKRFIKEMEKAELACSTKIRYRGLVFSFGQAMPFFGYALCLSYGGTLVADHQLPYKNVIKVAEALIFGSWMLGQALAYAPNVHTAISSAGRLLKILDRLPQYNNPPPLPYNSPTKTEGKIKYSDVQFHYPTRPDVPVLQNLNLDIQAGQTVALVGPSGSGKSSCLQLLLRYYDPINGTITLDGTPTTDFPMLQLRSHLGLVSQEPVLFDRTIAENIAYGDNNRVVTLSEIIEAARMANIHGFISSLPLGYDTRLGRRGAQLSGGQKQRIAIARALIRNPRILLLDEATSALDSQSQNIVQAALDHARAGRTCITIAHRLSTIQNADLICVINGGVVIEKGTHNQLMAAGQTYAKLFELQQVDD